MTEKRFETNMRLVIDTKKKYGARVLNAEDIVDLLNKLYEENQSSKEFIEQLQEELVLFKKAGADMGNDLNAQITVLKQENEQLKEQINQLQFNKAVGQQEYQKRDMND